MTGFIVYYLTASITGFYVLWVLFLAVMNLSRAKKAGTLSKPALILGTPVLFVGYLLDFLLNVFVMTIVLAEMPDELTVSARLKRHRKESTGWRLAVVHWFEPLLDPYDPSGDHV
jgi:hypothetical protein